MDVRPQPGPQEQFLASEADIAIFGGAAGGGKTWALLLEALRHIHVPGFSAVIFRRTSPQITNPGGLWDESSVLFPALGGTPRESRMDWTFRPRSTIVFRHLQHEKDKRDHQGAQLPFIGFDELPHFTRSQFFYLLSRNRSTCGIRPYIRATCNPEPDSWVAELIDWWIGDDGYPIKERAGVLRWFVVIDDQVVWADDKADLLVRYPGSLPLSLTFIPSKLSDNPALTRKDPGYLAKLQALPYVERARLLDGNWKIRPAAGLYFQRSDVQVIDIAPAGLRWVRYWDLAATEKRPENDPDWTVGVKMARTPAGLLVVGNVIRLRKGPAAVEQALVNTASADGVETRIGLPQDPGQAGKSQAQAFVRLLSGYSATSRPETGDKVTRFGPFSAQAQGGNVLVVRGPWNDAYFSALEGFPEGRHDDDADATAGAYEMLTPRGGTGIIEFYERFGGG